METLLALLMQGEGLRLEPYRCTAGHLTVGYGHRTESHRTITRAEADSLLRADALKAWQSATRLVGPGEPERTVVAAMCFQLGEAGTMRHVKTIAALRSRDYATACREMQTSLWYHQTPTRVTKLVALIQARNK